MTDAKLKSLSDRINKLLDERDAINADISDIYQEAKSVGYIPKVLRKAIGRMRMDQSKRDEEDSILELYESALDSRTRAVIAELKAGSTFDATSERTGTPRRTVARIAKTVPKTSESGTTAPVEEITDSPQAPAASSTVTARAPESCGGDGSDLGLSARVSSGTAPQPEREPGPQDTSPECSEGPEQGAVGSGPPPDDAPQAERPKSAAPSPIAAGAIDDIDLTIPPFLDRRQRARA